MITKHQMFPLILEACPSFAPTWKQFVDEWTNGDELPRYFALGELARHLVSLLSTGETGEFAAVFDVVERLHAEGDPYVKEAATVGLLEDLQNTNLHTITEPEQFRPYLKPESERWWDKLYAFWRKGKLLSDN